MARQSTRSPTLETLGLIAVVFVLQLAAAFLGVVGLFVLAPPLQDSPWTIVTSVYAHANVGHLLANATALVVFGLLVERRTTRLRFHLFFVTVGALSGISQVVATDIVGEATPVLGASGAVFGLLGYLLGGNVVTETLFERVELSRRAQFVIFALAAVAVTVATGRPGVALIAHFSGLLAGLLAGSVNLLDA